MDGWAGKMSQGIRSIYFSCQSASWQWLHSSVKATAPVMSSPIRWSSNSASFHVPVIVLLTSLGSGVVMALC